jgi:2-keto-4-pentenoate hydratase/2-oxohepta-3-ene-1,7-dioic acid hydratase in catechol pathway
MIVGSATIGNNSLRRLGPAMGDEKKPWEIGKSFDHAAVIGPLHPASKTGHFSKGGISLAVNGTVKQNSNLLNMSWNVAEQVSKLSEAFELKAGDIIYSGTPENVGPVVKGDVLCARSRACQTCRSRSSEGLVSRARGYHRASSRRTPGPITTVVMTGRVVAPGC